MGGGARDTFSLNYFAALCTFEMSVWDMVLGTTRPGKANMVPRFRRFAYRQALNTEIFLKHFTLENFFSIHQISRELKLLFF